jgi:hypothetical protein
MNFGSYAGGRVDDALVRDTTRARASKTRSPTGGVPCPVPSAAKKRAYWVWFAAILCLETAMVRRSTIELNPESTGAVRSPFLLHTQALNIAVHLLVDLSALRSLNALLPRWGVMYPAAFQGAPALRASEERAVVVRHFFKLLIRAPMVNCVLLGGKLDGFHAYQVRQLVMMVTSPTFFATLFAVKTARGLCALALVNVGFVTACAFSVPFAFKYSPDLREGFLNGVDPIHANVPRRFAELAIALAAAPFAARAAVLVFCLDAQPPSAPSLETTSARKWEGDTAGPGPRTTSAEKMKGWEGEEREEEARPEEDARAFSLEKAQLLCGAAPEEDDAASAKTDGFTPELSASALCFRGSASQCVTVRGVPFGVSLRVTFEGRVLRTTGELIRDAESGAARTLLRIWPPEPESGVGLGDVTPFDRGQSEGRFQAPFGRAWVSAGYVLERAAGRKDAARVETRLTFKPVGESVALLFLRDPETAREVNDATSLIRHKMNVVLANRLVMRIGNCIARATFNENENAVMLDLTATVGMRRCQRMLSLLSARVHGEGEDADISQANSLRRSGGAAEGTRAGRGRSAARGPGGGESPGCSDDSDAVDGPEAAEASGGARRGFLQTKFGGGETAAAAGGDAPGGDLRRRTARRRVSRR